jgi:hypothetical protein
VTADELARHLAAVDAGAFDLATPPMISAWGRRPAEAPDDDGGGARERTADRFSEDGQGAGT